jgi:MoaA/NifB/PqqE/SkfB family radical SAM enzyme
VDVVRHFDPVAAIVCGGEPFMRPDCLEITRRIKELPGYRYVTIITNGWFLSEARAGDLLATGIDQVNVSLNWPDERQDQDRRIPGLWKRISHIVPWMTARGAHVELNTILMKENLDEALRVVELAASRGATVLFTLYSELPAQNREHLFSEEMRDRVRRLCEELLLIRRTRGIVANEDWYLERVPLFVSGVRIDGCTAGKRTIHVTPEGLVRACAELPPTVPYQEYEPALAPWTECTACFQACRGEAQSPLTVRRIVGYLGS